MEGCRAARGPTILDLDAESLARILSHLSIQHLSAAIATASGMRAPAIDQIIAWDTAILDMDPFAEMHSSRAALKLLGPAFLSNGFIGFFGVLTRRGGTWVRQALELDKVEPLRRHSSRLVGLLGTDASSPLVLGAGSLVRLVNRYSFEPKPFVSVGSQAELTAAIERAQPFQSIAVHCSFEMRGSPNLSVTKSLRLVGSKEGIVVSHLGLHGAGYESRGTIFMVWGCALLLEGLTFHSGEEPEEWEFDDWTGAYYGEFFPAIDVTDGARLMMRHCTVEARNGTAVIMMDGSSAHLEDCTLSTPSRSEAGLGAFLGLVMGDNTCATVMGCTFCYNCWGMFVGKDVDDETETGKFLLRQNTFHSNAMENISNMDDNYQYYGQRIQPWRPKWSEKSD